NFPLYLYPEASGLALESKRRANLSDVFLRDLTARLSENPRGHHPSTTPEMVLHYIYAVLHSPNYRARYAEFLKMDFPRLPLPSGQLLFEALCRLGSTLVSSHLLAEHDKTSKAAPVR